MGLGMVLVVAPKDVQNVIGILEDHGEHPALIGTVRPQISSSRVALLDGVFPDDDES
jgi:phosphoribosylaminoimidazole (AIR) synthetase